MALASNSPPNVRNNEFWIVLSTEAWFRFDTAEKTTCLISEVDPLMIFDVDEVDTNKSGVSVGENKNQTDRKEVEATSARPRADLQERAQGANEERH